MTAEPIHIDTDVLVIGSGAAGMYAAIEAARNGAHVLLADRSLIGRGGATVMAQMTVACALGEETPDNWQNHYADTIAAGRGLCDEKLAQLCARTRRTASASSSTGASAGRARTAISPRPWRRATTGRAASMWISSTPVPRCRRPCARRWRAIPRSAKPAISASSISSSSDGEVTGAVAYHLGTGAPVVIAAKATVLATGGLTRLYRRNSASANMGGDGYALALRAGATLIDMEFVQFFPIGHLAPRLVGMDPIMWDPFRYKLGGRLLNGQMEEFTSRYGSDEDGKYVLTRDLATYAIIKEAEAGRGSPHGGAYLSFEHCSAAALRAAFGPVIDRLAANHIDLTRMPVEVAPIAHYHMGGVKADAMMATDVQGLYVAGEVVGGANGANRLSGNAITEALVFGRRAGHSAAARAKRMAQPKLKPRDTAATLDLMRADAKTEPSGNTAAMVAHLQAVMADHVGPFRTGAKLSTALDEISGLTAELGEHPSGDVAAFDLQRLEWFDLRNMLSVAHAVTATALKRTESRGAHQREDFPKMLPQWQVHQRVQLFDGALKISGAPAAAKALAS